MVRKDATRSVVVAQLVEQLLPTPEIRTLNPVSEKARFLKERSERSLVKKYLPLVGGLI